MAQSNRAAFTKGDGETENFCLRWKEKIRKNVGK